MRLSRADGPDSVEHVYTPGGWRDRPDGASQTQPGTGSAAQAVSDWVTAQFTAAFTTLSLGQAEPGTVLGCATSVSGSVTFQWQRSGTAVATGPSYTVTPADVGRQVRCVAEGPGGASSASNAIVPLAAMPAVVARGSFALRGNGRMRLRLTPLGRQLARARAPFDGVTKRSYRAGRHHLHARSPVRVIPG